MRKVIALLLIAALPLGLAAMDFGFTLSDDTSASFVPDLDFSETLTLTGWINVPFGESLGMETAGYGRLSGGGASTTAFGDLSTFYLDGSFVNAFGLGTRFEFQVGRTSVADPTGLVLRQSLDGFALKATWPTFELGFCLGGTGLLFRQDALVVISQDDLNNLANTDPFALASSRLVGMLSVKFAELVVRQDLDLFVMAQFDFNNGAANIVNGQYIGLKVTGPIGFGVYYDLYGVYNIMQNSVSGSPFVPDQGIMLGGNISYAGKALPILRFELGVLYTSGDTAPFGSFRPVSRFPLAWIIPVTASDVGILLADVSVKPGYGFALGVKGRALFRTSAAPLQVDGFDPTSGAWYLGTEASLYVDWLVVSDFRVGCTAGAFFPNAGGSFLPTKGTDYSFSLAAKLNF